MQIDMLPHCHTDPDSSPGESLFLRQALAGTEEFRTVAELFSQLSDPTRIRTFWLLCHCDECVMNIAALLDMSSPAVSHHLRSLRNAGLIVSRRQGKEVFYRAADTEAAQLLHQMIERVMSITCPEEAHLLSDFRADQVDLIRQVHDYLLEHLDAHITIETLSREFHMNPTTLKAVFKSVYGNSLAAHIKEHRMEKASELLRNTDMSITEISGQVGYDNPGKFTAAFKAYSGLLPREFRKSVQKH